MPMLATGVGLQAVLLLTAAAAALTRAKRRGAQDKASGATATVLNDAQPGNSSDSDGGNGQGQSDHGGGDVTILFGSWSDSEILLVATICVVILLILAYMAYQRYRAQRAVVDAEQRHSQYAIEQLRAQSSPPRAPPLDAV